MDKQDLQQDLRINRLDQGKNRSTVAPTRRGFLAGAGALSAAALVGGCASDAPVTAGAAGPSPTYPPLDITDNDILNFALNLEYLEAEVYLRASTGAGVPAADAGSSNAGAVNGGAQVSFSGNTLLQQFFYEIAQDELNHIRVLRAAITNNAGTPIDRPTIDLTAGFSGIAAGAGLPAGFNPFTDANSIAVGAFSLIDVGLAAYTGAAPLLSSNTILNAAAGIQGAEGYHSGAIRAYIAGMASLSGNSTFLTYAQKISAFRATLDDQKETSPSISTVVYADSNAIGWGHTTSETLHLVYGAGGGAGLAKGGFFPNGLNGTITTTTA